MYFNSIKVRLEHNSGFDFIAPSLFQFHKGTIRTRDARNYPTPHRDFNSIKVRLELSGLPICKNGFIYFNSIKVRLEPWDCSTFYQHPYEISIP